MLELLTDWLAALLAGRLVALIDRLACVAAWLTAAVTHQQLKNYNALHQESIQSIAIEDTQIKSSFYCIFTSMDLLLLLSTVVSLISIKQNTSQG